MKVKYKRWSLHHFSRREMIKTVSSVGRGKKDGIYHVFWRKQFSLNHCLIEITRTLSIGLMIVQ